MWKENPAPERSRPPAIAKQINEDEFCAILDRLEPIHDMIRENGELRNLVSQRDAETKQLRIRNTEMEEMLRKFGTILVDAGTAMELAAKNEKPPTKVFT
jgi:hypothetical protein